MSRSLLMMGYGPGLSGNMKGRLVARFPFPCQIVEASKQQQSPKKSPSPFWSIKTNTRQTNLCTPTFKYYSTDHHHHHHPFDKNVTRMIESACKVEGRLSSTNSSSSRSIIGLSLGSRSRSEKSLLDVDAPWGSKLNSVGKFPHLYESTYSGCISSLPCFSSLLKSQRHRRQFVKGFFNMGFKNHINNYCYHCHPNIHSQSCRSLSTTCVVLNSSSSSSSSQAPQIQVQSTSTARAITSSNELDNVVGSINTSKTMVINQNCDRGGGKHSNSQSQHEEEPLISAAVTQDGGMKPKGVQHNWDLRSYTPKQIEEKCADVILQLGKLFDSAASAETLNFNTVLKPLLEAHRYSFTHGAVVTFPRHVADSQELRDAASQATKLLDESSVEMSMRKDVFDKLVEYKENFSAQDNLIPEYQRCLDRLIHTGRRNGLHLSEDVREKVKEIKKQMSQLQLQFSRNLGEENTVLLFSNEELDGMPATFLEGLEKDKETGKYKVTLQYPHFFPVTRKCRVPETRKKLEIAYQSKCIKENTRILEEVLELRQREAELLGYANHAAYAQDMQMAKNPENVNEFLTDLALKLQPLWKAEKAAMLELKKRECEKYNYEYNDKLEMWDFRYYMCLIEEEKYAVDQQLLMAYFPLQYVTQGMLEIYEELLSLKFTYLPNAQKWHDDVQAYEVVDRNTSEVLGYFYLDLFPREGKFGHACCVPLQPGCLDEHGVKQPAVSVMLTNFTRPKKYKPSLLDHKEVETYFHEFGHLMHTICSRAKSALLFGTRVETDFLETPSQMLENWVWEKLPLRRMSLHYELKTHLPDEIIDKLTASQLANAGGFNLRQIVLATFDQRVHLQGRCDTQALYAQILNEIMGLEAIPDTNMPANFNHLCIGYSGRYYSYLWSEVFSMDMYKTVFKEKGIFNPETGLLYRQSILEPGGSMDAMDMLKNFLGREPNNTAFLESKGLKPDA